jgi:hypothetical protein
MSNKHLFSKSWFNTALVLILIIISVLLYLGGIVYWAGVLTGQHFTK